MGRKLRFEKNGDGEEYQMGKGTEIFGEEKSRLKKMGVGKNIKLYGTLYKPSLTFPGRCTTS